MRRLAHLLVATLVLGAQLAQSEPTAFEDFHRALEIGDRATVIAYLRRGMDPNSVDEQGRPALVKAAHGGDLDLVAALLRAGAKVNRRNRHGDSAVMVAALQGRLEVVKLLRKFGAEINHPGWTPLLYASAGGHLDVLIFLLESGADLGSVAPNGVSALMMAVRGGHLAAVNLLLDHGADPKLKSETGATALQWALAKNQSEIVQRLRAAGAQE